jgi:hypothetical protein
MDVARLLAPELNPARVGFVRYTAQFTNMGLTFQRLDGAYRAKGPICSSGCSTSECMMRS